MATGRSFLTAASREAAADRERVEWLPIPTAAAAVFLRATDRCWERGVRDGPGLSTTAGADDVADDVADDDACNSWGSASAPFEDDFG